MKVYSSLLFVASLASQSLANINQEYAEKFQNIAVEQMMAHKIPASITLAQGILESGAGKSRLAVEANNHFGIKCHDWKGETIYHDDNQKGECFRKYQSAEESFNDHSLFLTGRERYASLFALEITDYKSWAKGLKKAGYATDPNYPDRLIQLIESLSLDEYDQLSSVKKTLPLAAKSEPKTAEKKELVRNSHEVKIINKKTKYVVVKPGDTFYSIALEFGLSMWELRMYNDFNDKKDHLEVGEFVYLSRKSGSSDGQDSYTVKDNKTTLRSISQKTGVRLNALERKNPLYGPDEILPVKEKISL